MKTLILSFIILFKAILQPIVERPVVLKVEFAVEMLKIFKRDNKSLCILSNEDSHNDNDQSYFNQVMKEINSQYVGYDEELAKEDFEIIFKAYDKFLGLIDKCIEILVTHLIPDDCRVKKPENNYLSKLLVDNLISKLNDLGFSSSGEMLAIACMYEMFYNELIEYSGLVNLNEQWLIDIYIYNFNILQISRYSTDVVSIQDIIKRAQEFIGRVIGARQIPGMFATTCLLTKSFDSYQKNGLQSILRYYITIVNELKNNESETCELNRLESNRIEKLVNKLNGTGNLNEIQTGGIVLGFQQLYEYMDMAHMYLVLDLYSEDYKYISRECNFNHQQFLNDYPDIIKDVLNNLQLETSDSYRIDLVKYCMFNNIRNKKEVKGDHTMLSKLDEIINAYSDFTYFFFESRCQTNSERCNKMTIYNLRRDSEEIDLINKNSYLSQSVLYCKVQTHKYKNQSNQYLDILLKFVYKYTYYFCPHKLSNVKLFADGISQDLFGIRNDKVVSFRFIENLVSEFLDQSVDNINVTRFTAFEYQADYCHIKHNINYSLIDFDDNINNTDYNKTMETILQKCSLIHSIAKYVDEFNSNVDLDDWLLLLDKSINFINNVSYKSLNDSEKFNALKFSIFSNLIGYKLSSGRQKRMDCEIEGIIKKGLEDLSIDTMTGIYLHLANKYSNSNCLLDTRMFKKKKIPESLVAYTKLYPSFEVLDDNKIRAYIIFLNRIILNVSTQLLSYDYPDMLAYKLVDPVSCKYQKTSDELNTIVLTYLENKYKDTETLWMNHVHFYKCLLLKDTRSFLNELYNNNQLSSKEIENITSLYHSILTAHPNLNEKNENNLAEILELLINTYQLTDFESNQIKLSMVYCYIRNLHTIIIIDTTSSTEESSTTDMIFDQSSMTSTITSVSEGNSITESNIKPKLGKGAIAGIVIGIIAIIFIFVCLMIYYFYVYRRKN